MTNSITDSKDGQCFLCGSPDLKADKSRRPLRWNGNQYTYRKCKECIGYSLMPELTSSDIDVLYSESYQFEENISSFSYASYYHDHGYKHAKKQLSSHLRQGMKLLDFGCGSDLTISTLCEAYKVSYTGVEANLNVVKKLQTVSPNNKYVTYQAFHDLDESFDCIFMGDVLEHVSRPSKLLTELKTRLRSNGVIIAQGPLENSPSLVHFFVKLKSRLLDAKAADMNPYHVSLATIKSIRLLVKRSGLKIVDFMVYEVMWPAKKLKSSSLLNFNQVFLRLLKFFDQVISQFFSNAGNRFIMVIKSSDFEN